MVKRSAIVPEQVIQNLEETFNETVFEGVTEELRNIEVTELDQASTFDYSDRFTVDDTREYLYLNNISDELDLYDSLTLGAQLTRRLAEIIEAEFNSTEDFIEYISDTKLESFFDLDEEGISQNFFQGFKDLDTDKFSLDIAQDIYEQSGDIEYIRDTWYWYTDFEVGDFFVYKDTEDDLDIKIVGEITEIEQKTKEYNSNPLTLEEVDYKITFEVIESNVTKEECSVLENNTVSPSDEDKITFHKSNPIESNL